MVFDIRLRLYTPQGVKGRVLKTLTLDVTGAESATPQLRFTTSSRVAGFLEAPFVVGVEYSTGAGWTRPRNDLFVAMEDEGDNADQTGVVRFTAQGYVPWLLTHALLHWSTSAKNGERHWVQFPHATRGGSATPGYILHGMLSEAKNRGWGQSPGPDVSWDFTGTKDSAGVDWSTAGANLWWTPWRLLTPTSKVLEELAQNGFCEWWSEGLTLRLFRTGTGVDRPNLKLGGRGFTRSPIRSSFRDVFTHLTVVPERSRYWLYLTNPGADTQFGRLEASMTQSGVEDHETAERLAQPALTAGRAVNREYSFDWTVTAGMPVPWAGFDIGDQVQVRARNSWTTQRVVGFVVTKNVDGVVTVRAVTGSKRLTAAAKLAKRTGAASMGTIIAGTGKSLPGASGPAALDPVAPSGLHVVSNTAGWGADGSAVTAVELAWDQVIEASDGSAIDVDLYEVWGREAADASALVTATDELSARVTSWRSDVPVWVKVRARSVGGVWSEFSDEISVTPAVPTSIIPLAPTGLVETANTAVFLPDGSAVAEATFTWDPVTLTTDGAPVTVAAYRPEVEDGSAWIPLSEVQSPLEATITIPVGGQRRVRVYARTDLGVWSDPSAPLTITGASPDVIAEAPTEPGLVTGGGGVFVFWDGELTTGVPPAGSQGVYAQYRTDPGDPWVRVAGPLAVRSGQVGQIREPVGTVVEVRLVLTDTLGRDGEASTVASITVEGYDGQDIVAGTIAVDKVTPNFGEQLTLEANGSVQIIINQQAEFQAELADTVDQVADAAEAAQTAQSIAGEALSGAQVAQDQVGTLADAQTEIRQQVDEIQTWFWVDEDGAHVGRSDSSFQAHVLSDRFQITENGVIQTYWSAGVMNVPKAEVEQIALANHKIEPYGTTTVLRAV
jgi:hypothetical protein